MLAQRIVPVMLTLLGLVAIAACEGEPDLHLPTQTPDTEVVADWLGRSIPVEDAQAVYAETVRRILKRTDGWGIRDSEVCLAIRDHWAGPREESIPVRLLDRLLIELQETQLPVYKASDPEFAESKCNRPHTYYVKLHPLNFFNLDEGRIEVRASIQLADNSYLNAINRHNFEKQGEMWTLAGN